ncbi:hypothetical protein [Humibacillus sp. DSM 29435]|uniref:hypothetical protein n=1 Tax=Humibacillus sp. DSM 29435 TaxID=1869167 RepID=UPI001586CFA6|nr:hypothetical protein [Humibacillus sp. DSM 29435]
MSEQPADLRGAGWRALAANPELELLPAVWPLEHRGWLPDRLPGIGTRLEMPSRRR